MFDRKWLPICALGSAIALPVGLAQASDHLDAPGVVDDGQTDLNDLYAFESPTNPDNTVLIETVNPFAGEPRPDFFDPKGSPSPTTFGTDVDYDIRIDNDGDAVPDVTYTTTFSNNGSGGQSLNVQRSDSSGNSTVASGNTGSEISSSSGGRVQAGLFDDPFFFDESGFFDGFNFTGDDAFAGANVSAIVLEVPNSQLGSTTIGVDATTSRNGNRIDRVGRPAINTALIPDGQKDAFNQGDPENDVANFRDEVIASIEALPGDADAEALADILLPDLLTYDTSQPDGFLNGRQLSDDVIDAELALLTDGEVTSDLVDSNDRAFPGVFPYLASPNEIGGGGGTAIPTPSAAMAGLALLGGLGLTRRRRRA